MMSLTNHISAISGFHLTWIQVDIADFIFVLNIHILFVAAD